MKKARLSSLLTLSSMAVFALASSAGPGRSTDIRFSIRSRGTQGTGSTSIRRFRCSVCWRSRLKSSRATSSSASAIVPRRVRLAQSRRGGSTHNRVGRSRPFLVSRQGLKFGRYSLSHRLSEAAPK